MYVFVNRWDNKPFSIKGVGRIKKVTMLGTSEKIKFSYNNDTLIIVPPKLDMHSTPCSYAWVYKLENALLEK